MGENTATSTAATSLKTSDFVHLHNHTHHSVLDGLTKSNELAEKVKEYVMEAAAVTDHLQVGVGGVAERGRAVHDLGAAGDQPGGREHGHRRPQPA